MSDPRHSMDPMMLEQVEARHERGGIPGYGAGIAGGLASGLAQRNQRFADSAVSSTRGLLAKLIDEAMQELAALEQVVESHIAVIQPILGPEPPQNARGVAGGPHPVGSAVASHLMTLIGKTREIKERLISATNRSDV